MLTASNGAGESADSPQTSGTPQPAPASPYDPPWSTATPTQTLAFNHNGGLTDEQNGANLKAAIAALTPGQKLEVGGGTYSVNSLFSIDGIGTAANPIWIVAKPGETPIFTRPNASQNAVNVGANGAARYIVIQGIEVTGGDTGIKMYNCQNVWIDSCHVHNVGGAGISANSHDTSFLYLTRNHIHDTAGTAEGMYLGANNSVHVMSHSVIALNDIHDTYGSQGDGIEIKQGSYGNWIVENLVHDTKYPCILAYGTDGNAFNTIERNVCYNSQDNVMQVQGEALVQNNLLINGAQGFQSHDHQGQAMNLTFIHNTIVNTGRGANLATWNNRPGMVFSNNVVYSQSSESIRFANGSSGVQVFGNVVVGSVSGAGSGYVVGNGLTDFVGVTWNGTQRDATPTGTGAIIGTSDLVFQVHEDMTGATVVAPYESGCLDAP